MPKKSKSIEELRSIRAYRAGCVSRAQRQLWNAERREREAIKELLDAEHVARIEKNLGVGHG
jgi:hypothetical protein